MDLSNSTLSYQPLVSRRRSSLGTHRTESSAPSSPVDAPLHNRKFVRESAVTYTYTCDKCGFGTNLLSSFMPHASNPCDRSPTNTWGSL
ncbi:hypothetical protein COEREDRAFT_82247 [Coemansia reversa NRRL 1564]|uniref:Uncharacterized protein n=1 Tax=Coemansia reversa (strain ATCC 12441 / NRRL 1564) TaxID=763665 RepID=A0A2G5B7P6_COERN|nr:hypothetical protein COEREDRAFT_82247 [Coemansia reversa NRRL 1564]|eukprot:PIA15029.1 hypothetical protein COEREDRAFT_82247 [Coemansia reversa NRRL 1564]